MIWATRTHWRDVSRPLVQMHQTEEEFCRSVLSLINMTVAVEGLETSKIEETGFQTFEGEGPGFQWGWVVYKNETTPEIIKFWAERVAAHEQA